MFSRKKIFIAVFISLSLGLSVSCSGPKDTVPTETALDSTDDLDENDIIKVGSLSGDNGYSVSGNIKLYHNVSDNTYSLVMDNFLSSNGPDLKVYISQGTDASDFSNLGDLKSTNGILRYDFPATDYDPNFSHILIWCQQFGVNFGLAPLVAP